MAAVASNQVHRGLNYRHIWTVARTDLKQLAQARDYWIPMLILGGIFFVFVPTVLLFTITKLGSVGGRWWPSGSLRRRWVAWSAGRRKRRRSVQ